MLPNLISADLAEILRIGLNAVMNTDTEADHADRLFGSAARWPGYARDAHADFAACGLRSAECHFTGDLFGNNAEIMDRAFPDAEEARFCLICVRDKRHIQHS